MTLRSLAVGFALPLIVPSFGVAAEISSEELADRFRSMSADHPRLFLRDDALAALRARTERPGLWANLRSALVAEADRQLATQPVERVLTGRRMLDRSRTCLSRVWHLGFAWRLTGERRYAERARAELRAAAAFSDWNPKHFLDVAEMSAALGIGLDWLWTELAEAERTEIRQALVNLGLRPSLRADGWSRLGNNWNQVCNGGLTIAALALAEVEPELAAQVVARAVVTLPAAMREYAPDGAYPEGPSYWSYGTTYNVLAIAALESVLGTDFGLSQAPGFLASADYMLHVVGPAGQFFNYADSSRTADGIQPALFWFAARRQDPQLLWWEAEKLSSAVRTGYLNHPLLLLWTPPGFSRPEQPPPLLSWTGRGTTPVALHRTGWERDATFIGLKGGMASTSHAHMDAGSFVVDADGLRWADDLGPQDYHALESQGVNLWSMAQDSDRWRIFRLGSSAHNVLVVDGQRQRVDGHAAFVTTGAHRTVVDLSPVYRGQLAAARRGAALRPDRTILIQDEFTAPARPVRVRWAMVVRGEIKIESPDTALLAQAGRTLRCRVIAPAGTGLRTYPTDPPTVGLDAPNPGTCLLGFETELAAGASARLAVHLVPGSASPQPLSVQPLSAW